MSHLRANTSPIAFVLFSIALWFLPSPAQAQLERVTLGYPATAMSHFPAFVGREFGQFREEGLDVQLVRVTGNVVVAALLAGELGYTTSADATVRSPVLGMPIKMLAAIGVKPSLSLIVRPEIKTVADLKGKAIAISTPGTKPLDCCRRCRRTSVIRNGFRHRIVSSASCCSTIKAACCFDRRGSRRRCRFQVRRAEACRLARQRIRMASSTCLRRTCRSPLPRK